MQCRSAVQSLLHFPIELSTRYVGLAEEGVKQLQPELIFGKGTRTATFQFSESGGSLNGPDLFTELLSCRNPDQTPHSLNVSPRFTEKTIFCLFLPHWEALCRIPFPRIASFSTRFRTIRLKSSKSPVKTRFKSGRSCLKSHVFRGTRYTPTELKGKPDQT